MKFLKLSIRKFALSVEIFVWNAARVKETARKVLLHWTLETVAGALRELYKVLSRGQLPPAAALMKLRAVIST